MLGDESMKEAVSGGGRGCFRMATHEESSDPADAQPGTSELGLCTGCGTRTSAFKKNIYLLALCPLQISLRNL